MIRPRVMLRLPLSPSDLAEALRFRALTSARVVVKPRERRVRPVTILPPAMPLVLVKPIPTHPVTEATPVASSLPTVRPPRRSAS